MKGIPTEYKYRRFRSRLEARWACLFDLMEWKYEYEPYDLNGWIPDFALLGHQEIIVEVKPYNKLEEFDTQKIINAIKGTEKQGIEILLLGSTIFENTETWAHPSIGWLGEYYPDTNEYWFEAAILNEREVWGFFHSYGSYQDRITGEHDGDHHLSPPNYDEVITHSVIP